MSVNSVGDDYDEHQQVTDSGDDEEEEEEEEDDIGRLREVTNNHHYHDHDPDQDSDSSLDYAVDNFLRPLNVGEPTFYQLACRFSKLYGELARASDQQFLPTPVTSLPSGQETGKYLAIDVGGSNLRVAFIDLLGEAADGVDTGNSTPNNRSKEKLLRAKRHRVRRTLEKAWPIAEHLKMDKADDLFLWIGDCMAEVVADSLSGEGASNGDIPEELEMGITFSFPMMYVLAFIFLSFFFFLFGQR